jgi:Mg2+ and Co2+ transporter CorA
MATNDVDDNLVELEAMPEKIAAAVQGIPADRWESAVWQAEGGWNRRQLLAHLASINLRQTLRGRAAAGLPLPGGVGDAAVFAPIDDWNADEVKRRSDKSVDDLLAELATNRRDLMTLIRSLSQEQRAQMRIARRSESMSFAEWLPFMIQHDQDHLAEIMS